jgi:ribulose-5-phosphate 4-epimerase/fuculose-1-phosphate aldolase
LHGSEVLGDKIAKEFAKNADIHTVILENHGVVIGHTDLFTAFKAFETIEYCARLHINANIIGKEKSLSKEQLLPSIYFLYMKQIHMLLQTQKPMLFPLLKAMAIR